MELDRLFLSRSLELAVRLRSLSELSRSVGVGSKKEQNVHSFDLVSALGSYKCEFRTIEFIDSEAASGLVELLTHIGLDGSTSMSSMKSLR